MGPKYDMGYRWDTQGIYIYSKVYSFYFPSEIAMKKFWQYIGDGI